MTKQALIAALCLSLAACATTTAAVPESVYALGAGLDAAEKAMRAYEALPAPDPQVVSEMKVFDQQAYAAIEPLLLNQNDVSADQLLLAQAALAAMTGYMLQHQVAPK